MTNFFNVKIYFEYPPFEKPERVTDKAVKQIKSEKIKEKSK